MEELKTHDLTLMLLGYLILLLCFGAGSLWAGDYRRYFRKPLPYFGGYILVFLITLLNPRIFPYGRSLEVLFLDMLIMWWIFIYFISYFLLRIKRWYYSRIQ